MKLFSPIGFLMAIVLVACQSDKEDNSAVGSNTENRIVVPAEAFEKGQLTLGKMDTMAFAESIKVNGVIDVPPANRTFISAVRGGYVKSIPPLIGSKVKKGELLMLIENPEFVELQQNYLETFQELTYQKSEYDRHSKMKLENVISDKRFMETENNYYTTKARYQGLKRQLELLNIAPSKVEKGLITTTSSIYAPISGYINRLGVSQGSFISPEKEILEIVNTDHIHLELVVYEKDILKIKPEQRIKFKIPEASQSQFDAYVYLINNTVEDNRTVRVHAHVKDEERQNFMVGMFVEAAIQIGERTLMALPSTAIIDVNGIPQILVLDERSDGSYYFKLLDVTIGESQSGFTEIKELATADKAKTIVISGAASLMN